MTDNLADPAAEAAAKTGSSEVARSKVPRGRRGLAARVALLVRAVADADASFVEDSVRQLGQSRRFLAPLAWAAGTLVLLLRGVKLLLLNWRLSLVELVPAVWIWLAMLDLKRHTLRGTPFRQLTVGGATLLFTFVVAISIAAFWCNTVFAFAIDSSPPPRIRPAIARARPYRRRVVASGLLVGGCLGLAVVIVPRANSLWLYVLVLGAVYGIMLISFVAVPARIIRAQKLKLAPKQQIGRLAAEGALSTVAMTPGFLLDRLGLILIGTAGLRILGFAMLSLGTALYAAGMSSVKAVKMSMKFQTTRTAEEPPTT
jgi:hypothetical protein